MTWLYYTLYFLAGVVVGFFLGRLWMRSVIEDGIASIRAAVREGRNGWR